MSDHPLKFPKGIKKLNIAKAKGRTRIKAINASNIRSVEKFAGQRPASSTDRLTSRTSFKTQSGPTQFKAFKGQLNAGVSRDLATVSRMHGGTSTDIMKTIGSKSATGVRPAQIGIDVAKKRTEAKASRANLARQAGGNSTSRMKSIINITKTAKAFDAARMSSILKKSRSPFLMAFALGLDELTRHKKARKINAGPI